MLRKIKIVSLVALSAIFMVGSITGATAQDSINNPNIPAPYSGPSANSPSWETNTDNGDGTFTFIQGISAKSSPPHYSKPASGGFSYYSWYNEDYGWQHNFPYTAGNTILSSTLTIRAWDVDSEIFHGYDGEYDGIFGDGNYLNPQYLQGNDGLWSVTKFDVNPSSLTDDELLNVDINIDMHHNTQYWATTLDYSELKVIYTSGTSNQAPYQPTLSSSPACPADADNLVVTVTGPNPADPNGDSVTYQYRWFVDTGTGFYVDDEFAGRGDHTGNTVPAADTQNGDKWRVQVIAVDEHGAQSNSATVDFAQIGASGTCQNIPEFPTMALPVVSVIGIMFLLSRRNGKGL